MTNGWQRGMTRQLTQAMIDAVEAAAKAPDNQVISVPDGMTTAEFGSAILLCRAHSGVPQDVKAAIADRAKAIVTGVRRSAYGTPEMNFERVARFWQAYFENTGRGDVKLTAADVSPMMRLMKEARLCETPDHPDSFVDLVGYALTGAEVNKVDPSDLP